MDTLFNSLVGSDNSKQNVYYETRNKKSDISDYITSKYKQIKSIDYKIEDNFNHTELTIVLAEKLPNHTDESSKNSFIQDIREISESFFNLTHSKKIRIQLEVITTDRCRLFHVDHIKQRLLCTYSGPGTEWVENDNVNRNGLGKGNNAKVVRNFSKIKTADTFDVLLLRGEKFNRHCHGAVHRSPPVESIQASRVVLKMDEI